MSTADYREPTNDELWSQPPAPAQPAPVPNALVPVQPVQQPVPVQPPTPARAQSADRSAFILAIVSLVMAIPLTAIASTQGLLGMILVWLGSVAVNFVYGFRKR